MSLFAGQHPLDAGPQLPASLPGTSPSPSTELPHSNLYCKNFPQEMDEATLQQCFATYGQIESCRIIRPKTATGRAYGFIKLRTVDQARASIAALNGCSMGVPGLPLEVKFADADAGTPLSQTGRMPSDNVYVRNLPVGATEADLHALFAPFGSVRECRVLHPGDVTKGGGALARMGSVEEATRVIDALHGHMPNGALLPLMLRYADTPEEKARKLARRERLHTRFAPYGTPSGSPVHPQLGAATDAHSQVQQAGLLGAGALAGYGFALSPAAEQTSSAAAVFGALASPGYDAPAGGYGGEAAEISQAMGQYQVQYNPHSQYLGGSAAASAAASAPPASIGTYELMGSGGGSAGSAYEAQVHATAAANGLAGAPVTPQLNGGGAGGGVGSLASPASIPSSVYVKNLPEEADRLFLYERFAPFGAVLSVKVMVDEVTGRCRGVGFVNYAKATGALRAVSALHNLQLGDRLLHVSLQTHRARAM